MSKIISGIPTSGTTLLANLLGYHSKLSPIYETDFVLKWLQMMFEEQPHHAEELKEIMEDWAEPLPHHPDTKKDYEKYPLGAHHILFSTEEAIGRTEQMYQEMMNGADIKEAMSEALKDLFDLHAEKDGKPEWINKVPMYLDGLEFVRELFPEMKVINCVRDGRDFAYSIEDRPFGPDDPQQAHEFWARLARNGQKFAKKYPDQYLQVKYENLVKHTKTALARCCNFLGIKNESEQIIAQYPVEIYNKRVGHWQEKEPLPNFEQGEPRELLSKLGYI